MLTCKNRNIHVNTLHQQKFAYFITYNKSYAKNNNIFLSINVHVYCCFEVTNETVKVYNIILKEAMNTIGEIDYDWGNNTLSTFGYQSINQSNLI